jgi:hypothetical protein
MFIRSLLTALVGGVLVFASTAAYAADRGPSTPEERRQAIEYIHAWQADPLGPQAKDQFGWVLKWLAEVPDITVHVCTIFDKLPKGDKKDGSVIFGSEFMGQAAFVLEGLGKQSDVEAEYEAGVLSALRVYENLLKTNPKDRQAYLDELVQRREAGTLQQYVRERAAIVCH